MVMAGIRDVSGDILKLLCSTRWGDSDVSHSVFEISPRNERPLLAKCEYGAVSLWALDVLLTECEIRRADAVATFYRCIPGMPYATSLRGQVFRRQVLKHLDGLRSEHAFPIEGLTSFKETEWTYRGPIQRFNFLQDSDFIDELTKAVRNEKPLHLIPLARDFEALDSIIYDTKEMLLTCIQITIYGEQDILVSDLQRIQSWLKDDTPLAGLRPSKRRPWRFVFIVPSDEEPFEPQRLKGVTAQDEWAGKVHQCVLTLGVLGEDNESI